MSTTADDSIKYSPHRIESTVMTTQTPTPRTPQRNNGIEPDAEGVFVLYEDYQELERELSELEAKRKADVRRIHDEAAFESMPIREFIRTKFPDCFTGDSNESR